MLFPQQTGKLEIPSITFDGVVAQQTVSDDPFDAFFNGGGHVEVKKKITTPKVVINVQPLPAKPPDSLEQWVSSNWHRLSMRLT